MVMSTCTKCGGNSFEIVESEPSGTNFKYSYVQCSSCGGVIGVMDYYNIGEMLDKIHKKLGIK